MKNNVLIKKRFFILVLIGIFIFISSNVFAAGIDGNNQIELKKVRAEIEKGNFDNLVGVMEKTDITSSSILFLGLDNSKLIEAWKKLEIKGNIEKTNKYRQMLIGGCGDNKALDSFIGSLIKSNNGAKEFEFKGSENAKGQGSIVVNGDFIDLKDASGNIHKIPLNNLKGFKKMVFSEMGGGTKGYAVHYTSEKGSESGAILTSGYLKGDEKNGYDVMDFAGKEIKVRGHVDFGDNPQGAIYFRGVPKEIDNQRFSKGDYIFNKPGRTGDISFKDDLGVLGSSERDILNSQGLRVGYQSENGIRGVKKFDSNGDKTPDKIIDIVHQNGVGIKYGNKIIGESSNRKIEISDKGEDISVVSSGIINTEITNTNGKVFYRENNKEVNSGKGEPLKIVNGVVNGVFVGRQDPGAGSGSGRFNQGNSGNSGGSLDSLFNFVGQGLNQGKPNPGNQVNPVNPGNQGNQGQVNPGNQGQPNPGDQLQNSPDYQTFAAVNSARGRGLQWDAEMSRKAQEYSQLMSTRLGLVHSNMGYAENIAMFTSFQKLSSQEVGKRFSDMWMGSSGHYRNIMNGANGRTGVGVYVRQNGQTYTYYATQIFAK